MESEKDDDGEGWRSKCIFRLTQICNLTLLSCRKTVLTLKSMPTVETNAEVNESSAYRNKKEVLPTLELPMMRILNM